MPYHRAGKEIDLVSVCDDLFSLFEQDLPQEQKRTIEEYFEQRAKEEEISEDVVDQNNYAAIRQVFERDLLPAYNGFREKKEKILEKSRNRVWWKYVGVTVAVLEVAEAIATRGRSLSPAVMAATLPFQAMLGYGIYWALSRYDQHKIYGERRKLALLVKTKAEKIAIDLQHQEHLEVIGDINRSADYRAVLAQELGEKQRQ